VNWWRFPNNDVQKTQEINQGRRRVVRREMEVVRNMQGTGVAGEAML